MTTKKQLKEKSERLECQLTAQVDELHRSIIKCERVEHDLADADKTIDFQRAAIRTQNESMSCTGCQYSNRKHPQKCACCRRGAKDNYTPDKPDAEANVISDDFLKSTEATT